MSDSETDSTAPRGEDPAGRSASATANVCIQEYPSAAPHMRSENNTAPITDGIIIGLEACLTLVGPFVGPDPPELGRPTGLATRVACGSLKKCVISSFCGLG